MTISNPQVMSLSPLLLLPRQRVRKLEKSESLPFPNSGLRYYLCIDHLNLFGSASFDPYDRFFFCYFLSALSALLALKLYNMRSSDILGQREREREREEAKRAL